MEIITLIISGIALAVSIFTFWLGNIYDPKKLYITRSKILTSIDDTVEVAIINNRKSDIFIANITSGLEGNGRRTSGRTITASIGCGKIQNFSLNNYSNISQSTIESGKTTEFGYLLEINVYITWIDKSGTKRTSVIEYDKLHFDKEFRFHQRTLIQQKKETNLYKLTSKRWSE